ncbi:protein FAM200C-like [Lycorma delicatula]|uniref:protein FAM200C-like n=1 Tax=Lycorma delicatula TaxID=130591 RepID=UPI003F50DD67
MNVTASICTDGAPAMLGKYSGFFSHIKRELPHVTITHCMLHRHVLASKALPKSLKKHLNTAINVVKYIRGRELNHRSSHFWCLCEEICAAHNVLLYHTEIRWLSKGRMLNRFFDLREEIIQLLTSQNCDLVKDFESKDAILR